MFSATVEKLRKKLKDTFLNTALDSEKFEIYGRLDHSTGYMNNDKCTYSDLEWVLKARIRTVFLNYRHDFDNPLETIINMGIY